MREIMILVKHTIRLLLRNKGFLFFLVILPTFSVLLLNIKDYSEDEIVSDTKGIYEMKTMSERICYDAKPTMLAVKVYDSTGDGLGITFSEELAKAGIFQVFYCDSSAESEELIQKDIDHTTQNDRVGAILYLTSGFFDDLKSGILDSGFYFYDSKQDDRTKLLYTTLQQIVGTYETFAAGVPDSKALVEVLNAQEESELSLQMVNLESNKYANLSYDQEQQVRRIGYSLAMLTISFLFTGVMIGDTVIKERQYKVFSRIKLTEITPLQYILSKYIVCVISAVLQTGIIAIELNCFVHEEYAISKVSLMIIIGILGLIFNTLSLCIGILSNNVMNTNYLAFTVWSVSCMLSGCYFDLSDAGPTIIGISNFMPQKWGLDSVRMLMTGQPGAFPLLLVAAAAFLIVIGVGGVAGTMRSLQD
jgi:ABC-2 type transport system permease protein